MAPDPANCFPEASDCSAFGLMIEYRIVQGFFFVFLYYDAFSQICPITTFYLIWYWVHGGCDRSPEDVYFSMARDPTFIFLEVRVCLLLICNFPLDFWIRIVRYYHVSFKINEKKRLGPPPHHQKKLGPLMKRSTMTAFQHKRGEQTPGFNYL